MKNKALIFSVIFFIAVILAVFLGQKEETNKMFAMDTVIECNIKDRNAKKALEEIEKEIERLDFELNVNGIGALSLYNESGIKNEEIKDLIDRSCLISSETGGAFDITIYPVLKLWGFTTDDKRVPEKQEIESTLLKCGYERLENENIPVDFGAVAKGYAADRIKSILDKDKVRQALISVGGTVLIYGKNALVAVKSPDGEGTAAVILCDNVCLSTSGGYERYFEKDGKKYSHIIDPKSGHPAESKIASVTVISEDGFLSDALSTAFYVSGEEGAKKLYRKRRDFEMLLITDDGRIIVSDNVKLKDYDKKYKLERMKEE